MGAPGAAEQHVDSPPRQRYRSAALRLRAARIGIGITLVAAVIDSFLSLVAASVTGWAIGIDPAGAAASLNQLNVSAGVADLLGRMTVIATAAWVAMVLTLLAAGINLLRWQTAAVANLTALGHRRPRSAPWLAAAAWLVPIWSSFGPLVTFVDLWRSSDPAAPDQADRSTPRTVRVPARHAAWWGLWLGALLLTAFGVVRMSRNPTLGTMLTEQLSQVVVDGALVGAGLLLVRILTETTARQDARHAARTAG
jgi:Domain of unknown function (DUF4328)